MTSAASQPLCLFVLMQRDDGTEGDRSITIHPQPFPHMMCRICATVSLKLKVVVKKKKKVGFYESVRDMVLSVW